MDRLLYHPIIWNIGYRTQKRSYRKITRRFDTDDVVFLNYGYEEDPPMAINLDPGDEPDRFPIQLYRLFDLDGAGVISLS